MQVLIQPLLRKLPWDLHSMCKRSKAGCFQVQPAGAHPKAEHSLAVWLGALFMWHLSREQYMQSFTWLFTWVMSLPHFICSHSFLTASICLVFPNCCFCCYHQPLMGFVAPRPCRTARTGKAAVESVCCSQLRKSRSMKSICCLSGSTDIRETIKKELKMVWRKGVCVCMHVCIYIDQRIPGRT